MFAKDLAPDKLRQPNGLLMHVITQLPVTTTDSCAYVWCVHMCEKKIIYGIKPLWIKIAALQGENFSYCKSTGLKKSKKTVYNKELEGNWR